jgi:cyclic dehypoxanthinyl futalosine synthase
MGISRQQAADCFRSDDLIGIGMEADALRRHLHPEAVVTYRCVHVIDVDSSPVPPNPDVIHAPTSTIRLNSASADLDVLEQACTAFRRLFPSTWIEAGLRGSAICSIDALQAVARTSQSGADSIFVDPRHEHGNYSRTCSAALELHRAAHARGMRTIAAIPFGCGESVPERLDCLEAVFRTQQETGGFVSCLPVGLNAPGGRELDGPTAVEQLKIMAITRMYVDNVEHLQSAQTGAGLKVLQTALRFGADDAEIRIPQPGLTEQDLRRVIRDAGFRPVERDGPYSILFLN